MRKVFLLAFSVIFLSVAFYSIVRAVSAPSNLTATATSCSQVNLSWRDNSNDETGFKIERKNGASGSWSQIATVGANTTTYTDFGLTGGATYYYRVSATSAFIPPSSSKYKCNGASCIRDDTNGTYTTSNCDNACVVVVPKYKCSGAFCVRDDISGAYTDSNCNNSCITANQPPVAVAKISKDGTTYTSSITVTKGVSTTIYLSAADSSDPNGWTDINNGVSSGGKCEWNSDLNQGAPTFEQTINSSPSPAGCNVFLGSKTFDDNPGTYTYQVLRITDKPGVQSNIASVSVTVAAPPSSLEAVDIVTSCTAPNQPLDTSINFQSGVVYSNGLKMDIAWPKTSGLHPLVVFIHGGGWIIGDRTGFDSTVKMLAGQGYVAATIDYRLTTGPTTRFPAAVEDVRCAIKWLRTNASSYSYSIDSSRVAVIGSSAGAHLAGMLGTASDISGLDGSCSVSGSTAVKAVIGYFGAYDLRGNDLNKTIGLGAAFINTFLGPGYLPAIAEKASPIVHVDSSDPPHLLIHATGDAMVLIKQSRDMKAALQAAGVPATLIETPGGHGSPEPFSPAYLTGTCTALKFLSEQLHP